MFTGIIEELGTVRRLEKSAAGASVVIAASQVLNGLKIGDSIAVSGPCLTVTAFDRESFTAFVMPETLTRSTLGELKPGHRVNLERALALGGRLGGHMVSGHIDAVVTLAGYKSQGEAMLLNFEAPQVLLRYIVPKGSVALDGVSLTVIEVEDNGFSVGVIPHTGRETTLGTKEVGAPLNLEVDLISKYVEKMLEPRLSGGEKQSGKITMDLLVEKGYL
jgi:riboflavin synthase